MQSPDGNLLWCPSESLWSLITDHVTKSELQKIKTAVGYHLVHMYTRVHSEATMLQRSQQGNNSSRAGTPLLRQQGSILADPPAIKELVRAEVKMLLQTLRERSSRGARDGEELVLRYKPKTVDYALGHVDSCFRNCSNPEYGDAGSRPISQCSIQSNAEDEIEAMREKLNISDIDEVVNRLKAILTEECEALKRLVKHFKENIKQKTQGDGSEPTLAELRELRGAIQMDLELFPSSLAAPPPASSPLPLRDLKSRISMPAAQTVSEETLQALNTTSDLMRPHPPPPRCQNKPRPPFGAPPSKTSAKVKLINSSSLSRTLGQPRNVLASPGLRKTQTPICDRIASSWHADSHIPTSLPGPVGEQIMVQTTHNCSPSPEQDSADLHCRNSSCNPSFQIKTPTIHETHLSSSRSIHSPGRKFDFSPQTVRRGTATWRRRPINTITASPQCDADSYSSSSAEHSVSAAGKSKTQNSTCRGSLVSTPVQADNNRGKITPESLHSLGGSRRSNAGLEMNKNGHLGKDVTQQQSLVATV
ncbi:coiled-coil domain-containing protein 24 [Acanthopagrus schlegelii]